MIQSVHNIFSLSCTQKKHNETIRRIQSTYIRTHRMSRLILVMTTARGAICTFAIDASAPLWQVISNELACSYTFELPHTRAIIICFSSNKRQNANGTTQENSEIISWRCYLRCEVEHLYWESQPIYLNRRERSKFVTRTKHQTLHIIVYTFCSQYSPPKNCIKPQLRAQKKERRTAVKTAPDVLSCAAIERSDRRIRLSF